MKAQRSVPRCGVAPSMRWLSEIPMIQTPGLHKRGMTYIVPYTFLGNYIRHSRFMQSKRL
jgi:hypothetical protein